MQPAKRDPMGNRSHTARMLWKVAQALLVATVAGASTAGCIAFAADFAEPVTRPAALTDGPKSLQSRLRFPAGQDGDVRLTLRCASEVSGKGSVYLSFCESPGPNLDSYEKVVGDAAGWAVLSPAINGGRPSWVKFQYRVEFLKHGDAASVQVFPNHGLQVGTFGPDYSGPQRILEDEDSGTPPLWLACGEKMRLWAVATISEEGRAQGVSIEAGGIGDATCRERVIAKLLASRFIPAYVDGRAVRALYREAIFFRCSTKQSRPYPDHAGFGPDPC